MTLSTNWGVIATWRMAWEGVGEAAQMLQENSDASGAAVRAVTCVEDYPFYKSVGYGGLPNEQGVVELDAAFMDGSTLAIGAVASLRDIANPVLVAQALSRERFNSFMVGEGAQTWALAQGFERKNMLTDRAHQHYLKRKRETLDRGLSPYTGHDTVGVITLDHNQQMCVATSTSGLFMKRPGRVGDSPVSGSGFYADSQIGAATATGLGEDLMKGCISYEIVCRMGRGMSPQQAAESAVYDLESQLIARFGRAGDLSVVCMNNRGEYGAATTIDNFSFSVATPAQKPTVFLTTREGKHTLIRPADQAWLDAYLQRVTAEVII
ncbi:L-asparaginase [Buttiauxella ferragutiae ATCC 51602]|jgi:isoaspartyl peptidase/L-asparaginase-like protein (Ntn-hydrolase superfamily)|uniref:L-asparaginase n=1 Tax=Buttiauxella ferragutiae ATCC 51602 TaxID=1354252 RepID=A0ABX2W307_9ENTR|nr:MULTISPECIES: N(4)-(beta-N-acetylglucosaminyl)-L-asparaginase [Buttiauxella]AYN26937.1 N(4)-(beta-N-acetylglucosaminyl)-L-asparaginase [Buttiauxella sp. 3AFRM03]OAT24967.1 L-asparaginase [Buttiauxella ferragutiae ATCC 51602]